MPYADAAAVSTADALARARASLDLTAVQPVSWAPTRPAAPAQPDQARPDADPPAAVQPGTAEPGTAGRTAAQPGTARPGEAQPDTAQPPAAQGTGQPSAAPAGATPPGAGRPGTARAGTPRSGAATPAEAGTDTPKPGVEAVDQVPPPPPGPTAEEQLAAIRWRLDGGTLREVVDDLEALRELGALLDEPLTAPADNHSQARLLSLRAEVYRLLGDLGMAAAASRMALAHAQAANDPEAIVIAQAELAHVLRLRGDFGEADVLFEYAASAEVPELLRCVVHENAGRSCFDQGRHMEALDHFARAIRLGNPADLDLVERIDVALEAVYIRVLRDGWGPYPRMRREILAAGGVHEPVPAPPLAPAPQVTATPPVAAAPQAPPQVAPAPPAAPA